MTAEEAREALRQWREAYAQRDALIRAASEAGVTKHQIHMLTGLARTTIDGILIRSGGGTDV
jgi:hypothetical protein